MFKTQNNFKPSNIYTNDFDLKENNVKEFINNKE